MQLELRTVRTKSFYDFTEEEGEPSETIPGKRRGNQGGIRDDAYTSPTRKTSMGKEVLTHFAAAAEVGLERGLTEADRGKGERIPRSIHYRKIVTYRRRRGRGNW